MGVHRKKRVLDHAKIRLVRQAHDVFEFHGNLNSTTLTTTVENVDFEVRCHEVLHWIQEDSEDIKQVVNWIKSATLEELRVPDESSRGGPFGVFVVGQTIDAPGINQFGCKIVSLHDATAGVEIYDPETGSYTRQVRYEDLAYRK